MPFGKAAPVREARPAEAGTIRRLASVGRGGRQIEITMVSGWSFRVDPNLVVDHELAAGVFLNLPRMQALLDADDLIAAKLAATRQLSYRPRSVAELRSTLQQRGFRTATIDAVVERFTELGYLDDEEFARRWIANREMLAPRGKRLLKQELKQKGISSELVEEVIIEADLDDYESALALATHRVSKMTGLEWDAKRRRIAGYLERRGYGYDVVRRVDRALFDFSDRSERESDQIT